MKQGKVPTQWLIAEVIPIPKVGKASTPDEFRAINMLPIYEKTLEKVIHKQLIEFLIENNIIHHNQSGFRNRHSCETAIQLVMEEWLGELDCDKMVVAVFLDFKRAFETVDRKLLLAKLWKYGIRESAYEWFSSYLDNRCQFTKYDGKKSDTLEIKIGVPQGSVLGPLLFILYVNDIFEVDLNDVIFVNLFADDTLISYSGTCLLEICGRINVFLLKLEDWLKRNKLKLNVTKSKCMLLTSSPTAKAKVMNDQNNMKAPIIMEKCHLEFVDEFKYLGVIIDQHLGMSKNVEYVAKKMSKKVGFLIRVGRYLSLSTRMLIYKSIVLPHIDYCSTLFWGITSSNMDKLQKLHIKGLKAVLRCDRYTPTKEVLEITNMLTVEQRVTLNTLVFLHKYHNNMLPTYLNKNPICSITKNLNVYSTRSANDICVTRKNKTRSLQSIFYSGSRKYNMLDDNVKIETNIVKFKEIATVFVKNHECIKGI
jgi:Reverse transcriptase (RNA-dependent DNA polymerase)